MSDYPPKLVVCIPSREYPSHSRHIPLIYYNSIYVYKLHFKNLSQVSNMYVWRDKRNRSSMTKELEEKTQGGVPYISITLFELGGTLALKHPEIQGNGIV